jgi:hypothetical protein
MFLTWRFLNVLLATLFAVAFELLSRREHDRAQRRSARVFWYPVAPFVASILLIGLVRWIASVDTLFPLAVVFFLLILSLLPDRIGGTQMSTFLEAKWAPAFLGVLSSALFCWIWGSMNPIGPVHDETSYLLQSHLFAHGKWKSSSPPIPEFFEQMHVLVVPFYASKYFPGQALTLTPGVLLGAAGLMPLLVLGSTAGFLFALARRVSGGAIALIAWVLWVTAPISSWFRPSYFSEVTTSALWLASWWALLRWRDSSRERWLCLYAFFVGWGVLTRPLTMFLFAVPLGAVVLTLAIRRSAWKQVFHALGIGSLILLVIPIWCYKTTGNWLTTPLSVYTRAYMPYDLSRFGIAQGPPTRQLPSDLASVNRLLESIHDSHEATPLSVTLVERAGAIFKDMWRGWRGILAPAAVLGLFVAGPEGLIAFATSVFLLIGYLPYWHGNSWTLYYLELQPVLAYLTACGVGWIFIALAAERRRGRFQPLPGGSPRVTRAGFLVACALGLFAWPDIARLRLDKRSEGADQAHFMATVDAIPDPRAIVFVRYAQGHDGHRSLIANFPPLEDSPVLTVYDLGPRNAALLACFPQRIPYLYDEARRTLVRISSAAISRSVSGTSVVAAPCRDRANVSALGWF